MSRRNSGFTLLEVVIASSLAIAVFTAFLKILFSFANSYSENRAALEDEADFVRIEYLLRKYFGRASNVGVQQSGPAVPNFALSGNGGFVLSADLRREDTFNPLNSALPVNRSLVQVACCAANQAVTVNVPTLGPINVASACTITGGLSIEVRTGGIVRESRCFSGVTELNVATTGFNDVTQSTLYFIDMAVPSGVATGGNRAVAAWRSRLQLYLAPGFNGNQVGVISRYPVGFGT